tara:strand:+ start:1463 stop:2356 length:894 start_codon:yes stop_codon:yes gene_type:complete
MSSIRHITDEQFSDGTTIDGSRLEKGLQDLEEYINNVPDGDFKHRWLQSQMVLRYLPFTSDAIAKMSADLGAPATHTVPYFDVQNIKGVAGLSGLGGIDPTNVYRNKGYRLSYNPASSADLQVAWTTCFSVGDNPIIISGIDVVMMTYNTEYTNPFTYGSDGSPPEKEDGQPVDNIDLQLTMDNPFIRNIQVANSMLWHKRDFSVSNAAMSGNAANPTSIPNDMTPNILAGMGTAGMERSLFMTERDLNIPVPPVSRLRFSVILPNADENNNPWYTSPGNTFVPTVTLTILERLSSD